MKNKPPSNILDYLDTVINQYIEQKNCYPNYISANKITINKIEQEYLKAVSYADIDLYTGEIFHYKGIPCIPNNNIENLITLFPL